MNGKRIAIILVNWNGKHDTLACLHSLQKLDPGPHHVSTIVVDNGSTDDSVTAITERFPDVNRIESPHNTGFTGGNNLGMELALTQGADIVWLLNNDTVADPGALLPLVTALGKGATGIAGSKIYFMAGREFHKDRYTERDRGKVIWYAGGHIDWENMYASHRGVDEVDTGQYDTEERTVYVSGCSMAIRREVLERVGLFDRRYYLYFEDIDLCMRAKQHGYGLHYVPESRIWHKNAGSSDKPGNPLHTYYLTRNRLVFGLRYAPWRTRQALIREAVRLWVSGSREQRLAIGDAVFGRLGGQDRWQQQP